MHTIRRRHLLTLSLTVFALLFGPSLAYAAPSAQEEEAVQIPRSYNSGFPSAPPLLDGACSSGEWGTAASIDLEYGYLLIMNDDANLYLLLDITADTKSDAGDFFYLTFDVNRDRAITLNVDLNYGLFGSGHFFGLQYYLGPARWTTARPSDSRMGSDFGPSPHSRFSHCIWEVAISLREIQATPGGTVYLGVRMVSGEPKFSKISPLILSRIFPTCCPSTWQGPTSTCWSWPMKPSSMRCAR